MSASKLARSTQSRGLVVSSVAAVGERSGAMIAEAMENFMFRLVQYQ